MQRPPTAEAPDLSGFGIAEIRRVARVIAGRRPGACCARRPVRRLRRRPVRPAAADGVIDGFIELGPTFVKLGQVMASSSGIFPAWLAGPARRCLDEVPPFPAEVVRATISADLGAPISELFASFDDVPLSAASIGQVHACELHDGRQAVVKVQRPGLRHAMTRDLRVLHGVAWSRSAPRGAAVRTHSGWWTT